MSLQPIRALITATLVILASAASAATPYSWKPIEESVVSRTKDSAGQIKFSPETWYQVRMMIDGSTLAFVTRMEWMEKTNTDPAFAPVLDPVNFDKALPLYNLTFVEKRLSADNKARVTVFNSEPTPFWLYIKYKTSSDPQGKRSVKKDKASDHFTDKQETGRDSAVYSAVWYKVDGFDKDTHEPLDTPLAIRILVNPSATQPVPPAAPQAPTTQPLVGEVVRELSPFEMAATVQDRGSESLVPDCPKRDSSCRTHLRQALIDYVAAFKADAPFSLLEKGFLKARLGSDFERFKMWEDLAREMGPQRYAEFTAKWRATIRQEAEGYTKARAPAEYRPEATNTGVIALLKGLGFVPTSPMARALYKKLPGDTARMRARRAILEAFYGDQKDPEAFLAGKDASHLVRQADIIAKGVLKGQKFKDKRIADAINSLPGDTFAAAYCGPQRNYDVPTGGTTRPAGNPQEEAEFWNLTGIADATAAAPTNASSKQSVDKTGAPVVSAASEMEALCSNYWNRIKEGNALGDNTPPYTGPTSGKTKVPPAHVDKGEEKKEDDSKDVKRDMIAGIKMGIWAAVIGGILGGPMGLVLLGVTGMAAGWFISKQLNE